MDPVPVSQYLASNVDRSMWEQGLTVSISQGVFVGIPFMS